MYVVPLELEMLEENCWGQQSFKPRQVPIPTDFASNENGALKRDRSPVASSQPAELFRRVGARSRLREIRARSSNARGSEKYYLAFERIG